MTVGRVRRLAALVLAAAATLGAAPPSDSDLRVVRLDPDPARPGGLTTAHAFVANDGPDPTASAFTVLVDLPAGFTAEGPFFPASCAASAGGHLVSCVFGAGLPPLRTATALVPVRADADVPHGRVAVGHVRVASRDDRDPGNDRTAFTLAVD